MSRVSICLILGLIISVAGLLPDEKLQAQAVQNKSKMVIHEWGVFTAPRNSYWLKQDMLAEWSSFPKFFHGVWPKRKLAYFGPVSKPVIFFHTKEKLDIRLEVTFATGRPLIWWPPATSPSIGMHAIPNAGTGLRKFPLEHSLVFDLRLNNGLPNFQNVAPDHWISNLRKVNCCDVTSSGGYSMMGETRFGEKFVYYDGVMKKPKQPTVSRKGENVLLESASDHDWLDVFVIERNSDQEIVAGIVDKIPSGSTKASVKLKVVKKSSTLADEFLKRLVRAGLNKDEAQSLIDVWQEGLFQREGLTVFYRIPQKTYDKWLPLKVKPVPNKVVRVGIVAHFRMEPELESTVKELVKDLGSSRFQVRDKAFKRLKEIGGAAFPVLKKELSSASSAEVKHRITRVLEIEKLENDLEKLVQRHSLR